MELQTSDFGGPLLQIVKGSKIYGGLHAIEGVDFELRAGEIHALLGENGAGKSTLCKAIAGAITLTSGDYLHQRPQGSSSVSPQEALQGGVAMVYQESSLVPSMTVAQNLELGMEKLIHRLQQDQHRRDAVAAVVEFQRRSIDARRKPRHREAADGGDRPRRSPQRQGLHLRRADRFADARGDPASLPSLEYPARARRRHHLHFARARGSVEHRRPHHRVARRPVGQHVAGQGRDARRAGADDDRPRRDGKPLRQARRRSRQPSCTGQTRGKGALGRERHDGRGRQEHVLFSLLRRGRRHLRSGRAPVDRKSRRSSAARASATSCAAA